MSSLPFLFFILIFMLCMAGGASVYHEIWLPKHWDGRFLELGGGMAGRIMRGNAPHGSFPNALLEGYAAKMTDLDTENGRVRGINFDVVSDFGRRAYRKKLKKVLTNGENSGIILHG